MVRVFAYGTPQQPDLRRVAGGRRLEGVADALPGYGPELVRIDDPAAIADSGRAYHPIVAPGADPAFAVDGAVFEPTLGELAAADRCKGAAYKRVSVLLASGVQAWVYVKAQSSPLHCAPEERGCN